MAISLDGLEPEFKSKVEHLLDVCRASGVIMRPYTGLRKPSKQAKLWRQSRSTEQIEAEIQRLRDAGAPYLASVLDKVGPQHGPHVTNALPGLGWHQWGEAVDCFWAVDGRAVWSPELTIDGINGYRFYAETAQNIGLTAGGFWTSIKDWPHVQLRTTGSPISAGMTFAQIDAIMKSRFQN